MDPNDIWAAPAPPKKGDADQDTTYAAVGRALSSWELFEAYLSMLFATIIGVDRESPTARRAYGAVMSFAGRADMLQAASLAYFVENPDTQLQADVSALLKTARKASPRRNEIAHGIVQQFNLDRETRRWDWALIPAYYATNKRDLQFKPNYRYTSVEIDRFGRQFAELSEPASDLTMRVLRQN